MTKDENRTRSLWFLMTVLTVAAYHLSVLGLLMLLPLGWLKVRQGNRPFLMASIAALVGIVVVEALIKSFGKQAWSVVDWAVLGVPLMLIAGNVALVWLERLGWRYLVRLLVVVAVLSVISFYSVLTVMTNEPMVQVIQKSFDVVWKTALESLSLSPDTKGLDKQWFFETLKTMFLSSSLFVLFLTLGWSQWVVSRFIQAEKSAAGDSRSFFLPSWVSLVFLLFFGGVLALALLGQFQSQWGGPWLSYWAWSAGLILWSVHMRAGLGIVLTWVDRSVAPTRRWMVNVGVVAVLVLAPWALPLVFFTLPTIAVLELWVNFRKKTQGVGL